MVSTVSRWMAARRRGSGTASSSRTAPSAKSSPASRSTAAADVRSPTPTATTPRPRTRTSPPSSGAPPGACTASPAKAGWWRYTASTWMASRRRAGRAIEPMRARSPIHIDASRVKSWLGSGGRAKAPSSAIAGGSEATEKGSSSNAIPARSRAASWGRERVEPVGQRRRQGRSDVHGAQRRGDDLGANVVAAQDVGQELAEAQHLRAPALEHGDEGVVLLLGALDPRNVVEQQLPAVGRRQTGEFRAGPVHEHPAQRRHLRVDVGGRGRGEAMAAWSGERHWTGTT